MKDDITPPNLGQAPTQYDQPFLFRALNEVEKFARLLLSKGPIRVSDLTADSATIAAATIAALTATTLNGAAYLLPASGSWTPGMTFGGGSTGLSKVSVGRYQRIGDFVTAWGDLSLTAKGSSTGNVLITGLPVAASSAISGACAFSIVAGMNSNLNSELWGSVTSTNIDIYQLNSNTGTGSAGSHLNETHFTASSSRLIFVASYWAGS